MISNVAEIVL